MYLCIDTISSVAGITLAPPGRGQFASYFPLDPKNSSEGIIPTIDEALKKAKASLADLKGVFVIKGPGSFTGLRVGLSVANQFAHQLKIPITGLRTDEWWLSRTNQSDVTYLQSMNKAEAYVSSDGKAEILPLEKITPGPWFGQLSESHKAQLSADFSELHELDSIEVTWQKIVKKFSNSDAPHKTYELVEPFYGKEPNITKSKKKPLL